MAASISQPWVNYQHKQSTIKKALPDGDVTIVAVKKIEKGKDIVDAMQIQNMSNALSMKMGGMVYSEYLQTLINNAEIAQCQIHSCHSLTPKESRWLGHSAVDARSLLEALPRSSFAHLKAV
jgi:hypothetical protein